MTRSVAATASTAPARPATNTDGVVLADEQDAERRYREAVRLRRSAPVAAGRATPASRNRARPEGDGLVGRILLDRTPDYLDAPEFYIGYRQVDEPGLTVFSWTAPIAATFYQGTGRHELCGRVATRRTFVHRAGSLVDFVDEHDRPTTTAFTGRALTVAPGRRRRDLPGRGPAPAPRLVAVPAPAPTSDAPAPMSVPAPRSTTGSPRPEVPAPRGRPARPPRPGTLRAAAAVHQAISAPRHERLDTVLATLQPDQYHLVSADPADPLIVHGPPGSGKTIVAAHRAAYLVDDTPGKPRRNRVLLVGPTQHYVEHVRGVVDELVEDPATVRVACLDDLLLVLRGLRTAVDTGVAQDPRDVDAGVLNLIRRVIDRLHQVGDLSTRTEHASAVEAVYEALRANRAGAAPVTYDQKWGSYLRRLPPFRSAIGARRFLPLLAAIAVTVRGGLSVRADHVIVDEAQDVSSLEWALLRMVNTGSWTVLGDRAQRRSDNSCRSWSGVRLAIGEPTARIEELENSYRTSSAIMEFASRLLPEAERGVVSVQQGGIPPRSTRVGAAVVFAQAAGEALRLLDERPDQSVAVISMRPAEVVRALRFRGFLPDSRRPHVVRKGGRELRVLDAHQARGLEFDAVVVAEPAEFPTRTGRHGLLYTSLTRANRELRIVYSRELPAGLSGRRR